MSRPSPTEKTFLDGAAGSLEILLDRPATVHGIALLGHPHPLYGGTHTNKVVHTLARTFRDLGYLTIRPNFRGVGHSEGKHDDGIGETEDFLAIITQIKEHWGELPLALGGFSFGAYVQLRVAQALAAQEKTPHRLVLVGLACGSAADGSRHYETPPLPSDKANTLVIHGEHDEIVPLTNVFAWAHQQHQPITVIPDTGHFFHGQLTMIRQIMLQNWSSLTTNHHDH